MSTDDDERVACIRGLKAPATNVRRIAFDSYLSLIADGYRAAHAEFYEWLTSQRAGIVYFDVDARRGDPGADDEATLLARREECLAAFFGDVAGYSFESHIVAASSHGGTKLSLRFYCDAVLATPRDIKKRIQLLNLSTKLGGVFDEAVYGTNQKLRAVGCAPGSVFRAGGCPDYVMAPLPDYVMAPCRIT